MKHSLIRLQIDKSPTPLHVNADTVTIHHIFDQSVQQKLMNVLNVDAKYIFQNFVAPKPLTSKHSLLLFQPLYD